MSIKPCVLQPLAASTYCELWRCSDCGAVHLNLGDVTLRLTWDQIVDAQSQSICVTWSYHDPDSGDRSDKKEIQRLFRDLLLLTCKQRANNCRLFKVEPVNEDRTELVFDELAQA